MAGVSASGIQARPSWVVLLLSANLAFRLLFIGEKPLESVQASPLMLAGNKN